MCAKSVVHVVYSLILQTFSLFAITVSTRSREKDKLQRKECDRKAWFKKTPVTFRYIVEYGSPD